MDLCLILCGQWLMPRYTDFQFFDVCSCGQQMFLRPDGSSPSALMTHDTTFSKQLQVGYPYLFFALYEKQDVCNFTPLSYSFPYISFLC